MFGSGEQVQAAEGGVTSRRVSPAGRSSVSTSVPVKARLPLFLALIPKVKAAPSATMAGPVLMAARSATSFTMLTLTVDELFALFCSGGGEAPVAAMVAVLEGVPTVEAVAVTVMKPSGTAPPVPGPAPRAQSTNWPDTEQLHPEPADGETVRMVKLVGSVSVMRKPAGVSPV